MPHVGSISILIPLRQIFYVNSNSLPEEEACDGGTGQRSHPVDPVGCPRFRLNVSENWPANGRAQTPRWVHTRAANSSSVTQHKNIQSDTCMRDLHTTWRNVWKVPRNLTRKIQAKCSQERLLWKFSVTFASFWIALSKFLILLLFFSFFTVFLNPKPDGPSLVWPSLARRKKIDFSLFLSPFDFSRLNLYIAYSGQKSRWDLENPNCAVLHEKRLICKKLHTVLLNRKQPKPTQRRLLEGGESFVTQFSTVHGRSLLL